MASPFESLPSLVTHGICEYLDVDACYLSAFSLTSKRCAAAAETFRLKCIHLRLSRKSKLLKDLKRLDETLSSTSQGYSLVRQLKLTGELLGSQSEDGEEAVEFPQRIETPKTNSYDFCMLPTLSRETLSRFVPLQGHGNRIQTESDEQMKEIMEDAWLPLSDLILKLSLTDLVYACSHQIPPCILRTLHGHSLETRLHMHTFSLRSLYQHRDRPHDIDPDEYLLATSPCLYSVFAKFHMVGESGRYGYNLQALKAMLGGLAPTLKLLSMWTFSPIPFPPRTYSGRRDSSSPPPWRGFHGEGFEALPSSKGHLHTLVCDFSDVQTWFTHIYAEGLASLTVSRGISIQQVQALIETAQSPGLTGLRSLRLRLNITSEEHRAGRSMDLAASTLIRLLPPLESLDLEGITLAQHTLHAVADHHGQSLTKLRLTSSDGWYWNEDERGHFRHNDIERLAATCLNLKQLEIVTRRTQGDDDEVAIYHALAKFPRLKRVVLVVCTDHDIREPEADGDVEKLPPSVFRKVLVNVAIDANLARNIFHIVCSESSSIESLRLINSGGGKLRAWRDAAAQDVLTGVGRSWDCRRERMGGEVMIGSFEVGSKSLYLKNDFQVDYNDRDPENIGNRLDLRAVWLDLWPGPAGDRTSQWSSFPLVGA
ncbi:hypothetical protein BGZ61DRAFT_447379 [Ilyonectria robusta]|uniref:uncharacterized protein n=1 Tax=Ilyonectria robusta TaxID=1079257 RepID=UPI001E8DDF57|nr:uncharacterized protein BGZ61DRAFT_447379 [Ilyonectria robusta]KAH8721707.1 hypothetical protein BGZ61DRAFT_447379 [Ilyonectria robusta]